MKEEHLETEAILGLARLRFEVGDSKDVLPTLTVMHNVCDELDKGKYGTLALKALVSLWRELKLGDVNDTSLAEFRAVVSRIREKWVEESEQVAE